jgi:hypothetical protein
METIAEFISRQNYDVDKLYIDTFWQSLNNKKPIYLSDEIIKMLGYSENGTKGNARVHCVRFMKSVLTENEYVEILPSNIGGQDFNQITKPNLVLHGGQNKKHYQIQSRAFKKFILSIGTSYSKKVYDYYITLEEIMLDYMKYQLDFGNLEKLKLCKILDEKTAEVDYHKCHRLHLQK